MWIQTLSDQWVEYVAIVFGLAIAVIATVTKTLDEVKPWPRSVKKFGWVLVALAVLNVGLSLYGTRKSQEARDTVEYWSLLEVERAIHELLAPYIIRSDLPEMDDRFNLAAGYTDCGAVAGVCDERLHKSPHRTNVTWGEILSDHTSAGLERMNRILAGFGNTLSADVIMLIGETRIHPWLEFVGESRKRERRHLERGLDVSEGVMLCLPAARQRYGEMAERFGRKVAELEAAIGVRVRILSARLKRNDPPPLFLRKMSGLFFLSAEPASDE